MPKMRSFAFALLMAAASIVGLAGPTTAAGEDPAAPPTATLDGHPIPVSDVSKYYCDDFAYPEIRCSSSRLVVETRAALLSLLTSIEYVTIYDGANYVGSFMNVSQDYAVLGTIGWNDRISSFKARNSETGRFWTDWFLGGSSWSFCCNSQVSSLGSYDNTFSSVERT